MFKQKAILIFEKIWEDADLKEILIKTDNGVFSGQTRVYTENSEILSFAVKLRGFPKNIEDKEEAILGLENTYGRARFIFKTVDQKGHCEIEIRISGTKDFPEEVGELHLSIKIDPSEIDILASDLESLGNGKIGEVKYVRENG